MHALSLLALGLGLGGLHGDALAAPTTPPPPRAASTTPPPPSSASKTRAASGSSAAPKATAPPGPSTTPPPPTAAPTSEAQSDSSDPPEPEAPPQDLSSTWGFSRAQPLQPRYVRTDDPTYAAPNPAGFYSGVSVQGNHVPPFPAKQTGTPPAVLTWTGFERAPEGSRVFFELSSEAVHEVTSNGLTLRIRIRNTKVNVRNNTRYLDLRYFETPVRTVKVTRKGRDTVATVVLKREALHTIEMIDGKAGYKLLVVQFGDATPADAGVP
jgi:hypothetical protein